MKYLDKIKKICDEVDTKQVEKVIEILQEQLLSGKTIFACGDGGSAATASHLICDLMKTSDRDFKAICLNDNVPLMTAVANDLDYAQTFSFPLSRLAGKRDLLLVITGSGNSANIVKAVEYAKSIGMETTAFLGKDGGKVKDMVDNYVLVPSDEYGPIEDFHMILVHLITEHFKNL